MAYRPEVLLIAENKTVLLEMGRDCKFSAKSNAWEENKVVPEGKELVIRVEGANQAPTAIPTLRQGASAATGRSNRENRGARNPMQRRWKTITFAAARPRHGMRASQTIDGSMTRKKFLAYVERCLAPTLKRKDIVMIDNLPAQAAGVREAIEARGAMLRFSPNTRPT